MTTGKQLKAARALLGWSQIKLAVEAKISVLRIKKFEVGEGRLSPLEISTIRAVLKNAGASLPPEGEAPGSMLGKPK
jgi:transcriptional regulator with XRE-family HTH domain